MVRGLWSNRELFGLAEERNNRWGAKKNLRGTRELRAKGGAVLEKYRRKGPEYEREKEAVAGERGKGAWYLSIPQGHGKGTGHKGGSARKGGERRKRGRISGVAGTSGTMQTQENRVRTGENPPPTGEVDDGKTTDGEGGER